MAKNGDARQVVLVAALESLLSCFSAPAWLKAPATFIAKIASRLKKLTVAEREALEHADDADVTTALQTLGLGDRIEAQLAALNEAIRSDREPAIIPFPGMKVSQNVEGNGNIVAAGNVSISTVDMRRTTRRSKSPVLPGTVATDPYKIGYLKYLARRYNEFKESNVGKPAMKYSLVYKRYEAEMKFSIANTPLDRFDEGVAYLQRRIRNTKLGRNLAKQGNPMFESFEAFLACGQGTVN